MAENETTIEALFERAEAYTNSTIELVKLSVVAKSADIVSSFFARLAIFTIIAMALLIVNMGLALWFGYLLGNSFYGFFIVGGFYALLALLLFIFRQQLIKNPISNSIIKEMLKP
jgi:hypothetical protein